MKIYNQDKSYILSEPLLNIMETFHFEFQLKLTITNLTITR